MPSPEDAVCDDVLLRIYTEEPSYWPYGLNRALHQDMYTVKDASTGEVVGFTGWQARVDKSGERVGSYSIGILPEHRGRGFARSALTGLLREKRASVDRVQAFIMPHNLPSMRLAQAFGIQITHEG